MWGNILKMNKRNVNLDLIKAVACICVVGLHAVGMTNYTIYYLCDCGVPLFLMVNGYLLLSKESITYSYAFKKILNILKVAFLWNLLIALPIFILRHKLVNPFKLTFDSLFQKGYLWHFWFFGAILIIYILLPLLHRLFVGRIAHHCTGCLTLMFICLCMNILSIIKAHPLHMFVPQPLRLWTWLFFFLAGGLFASISHIIERFPARMHLILLLILTFINNFATKKIGLYLIESRLAEYFYDDLTSILWHSLLFTFLLRLSIKEAYSSWISGFANLTMGIFIIHPILLTAIRTIYIPVTTAQAVVFWLALLILSAIITFIISKIPLVRNLVKL